MVSDYCLADVNVYYLGMSDDSLAVHRVHGCLTVVQSKQPGICVKWRNLHCDAHVAAENKHAHYNRFELSNLRLFLYDIPTQKNALSLAATIII